MKQAATLSALTMAFAAAGALEGAAAKTTCTRGADARVIEVVTPGAVGQSCDVRYTRSGGANVSVPYHADNSDSFCTQKAGEMVKRLSVSGFVCVQSAPKLRADAEPSSDYVVEAKRPEPAPVQTPEQSQGQSLAAAAPVEEAAPVAVAQTPAAAQEPVPASTVQTAAAQTETGQAAVAEEASALEDEMSKILAQPSVETAPGEPAQLVAQHAETPARPQPTPVGRLVGAEPEALRPATQVTQASLQEPAPQTPAEPAPKQEAAPEAAAPAPQEAAPAPKAEPTPAPKAALSQLREPADVIRATLAAQTAAWNEGDLDGFMNGYWKSDDLKFVSGSNITKGWNATMKRYRDRYAGGDGLGQLSEDKLEVRLVTDDVATVTGRFNLARGGETSTGTFTLVMRRDAGAWRIVHDHTTPDPAQ